MLALKMSTSLSPAASRARERLLERRGEGVDPAVGHVFWLAVGDDEGWRALLTPRAVGPPPGDRGVVGSPAGDARSRALLALGQNAVAETSSFADAHSKSRWPLPVSKASRREGLPLSRAS